MSRALIATFALLIIGFTAQISIASTIEITADASSEKIESSSPDVEAETFYIENNVVFILLQNVTNTSQTVKVKIENLPEPSYDVYINQGYTKAVSRDEFASGVEYTIPGSVADKDALRCLRSLEDRVVEYRDSLQDLTHPEAIRVHYTLKQAANWVQSGLVADKENRSLGILTGPEGKALTFVPALSWPGDEGAKKAALRSCWLLMQARDRMNQVIKDPDYKNIAISGLTPFFADVTVTDKALKIDLINDCDVEAKVAVDIIGTGDCSNMNQSVDVGAMEPGGSWTDSFDLADGCLSGACENIVCKVKVELATEDYFAAYTIEKSPVKP